MQRDDGSVLLRRQLSECSIAADRHAAAVDALRRAAVEEATAQPPRSGWLVVSGSCEDSLGRREPPDPNPPRLWFDLTDFGADLTGTDDCSAALSAALDAASNAGGGATILVPAGRYRIACPVLEPEPASKAHSTVASAPLSAPVHLIGEGSQHSELLWEAVGWQLLAAPGGGTATARWRRAEQHGSSFPLALASHGLVLAQLSVRGTTTRGSSAGAEEKALAARSHRVGSFHAKTQCDTKGRAAAIPMRYDVRLQHAQIVGFRTEEFDRSPAIQATVDENPRPCQLLHAKQRDQGIPQNLKRGCAVCNHTARAYNARMLVRAYERWLNGAEAAAAGDLHGAAAEFGEAATSAAAAGEPVEAGLLWSNQAECLIRGDDYSGATLALRRALQHWPEHGDSKRRAKFVMEPQVQKVSETGRSNGCCELDLKFFGFERTVSSMLQQPTQGGRKSLFIQLCVVGGKNPIASRR